MSHLAAYVLVVLVSLCLAAQYDVEKEISFYKHSYGEGMVQTVCIYHFLVYLLYLLRYKLIITVVPVLFGVVTE